MEASELSALFDKAVRELPGKVSKAVRKTAFDVRATAQQLAPYDTGNLRNSITVETLGPYAAAVGPTANYGRYVEEGTAPHVIVPKNAKALYFNGIFTSRVSHPGTRAQPYMAPAAERHAPALTKAIAEVARAL